MDGGTNGQITFLHAFDLEDGDPFAKTFNHALDRVIPFLTVYHICKLMHQI